MNVQFLILRSWLYFWPVLWIRPDPDPELFAGSGVGSGINHFGSGSGQSGSGMNFIPNFFSKLHKKWEYLAHIYICTHTVHTYTYTTHTHTYLRQKFFFLWS